VNAYATIPNASQPKRNEAIDDFCQQLTMSEQVRVLMNLIGGGTYQPDCYLAAIEPLMEAFDRHYDHMANAAAAGDCDPEERERHNNHMIERALLNGVPPVGVR
jgi:hypothetical protein